MRYYNGPADLAGPDGSKVSGHVIVSDRTGPGSARSDWAAQFACRDLPLAIHNAMDSKLSLTIPGAAPEDMLLANKLFVNGMFSLVLIPAPA